MQHLSRILTMPYQILAWFLNILNFPPVLFFLNLVQLLQSIVARNPFLTSLGSDFVQQQALSSPPDPSPTGVQQVKFEAERSLQQISSP